MKNKQPLFGPSSVSDRFYAEGGKSTVDAMPWVAALGLDAFEYSFGRGVNLGEETARAIGAAALANKITLSVHGPYYINLNNTTPEKIATNLEWFKKACTAAQWMGADRIVFHPGSGRGDREGAQAVAEKNLLYFLGILRDEGLMEGISLCPETMGKKNQLGNLEEVLALCLLDKAVLPCIDFGHLHAAEQGAIETDEAAYDVLDKMEKTLGKTRCRDFHMHFSPIEFGNAGEIRHRKFGEGYGPDFLPVARAVKAKAWTPRILCESQGTQADDAVEMKAIWEELKN